MIFATFVEPSSWARSSTGIAVQTTSSRTSSGFTRLLLMYTVPPGFTMPWNFFREGSFMAMRVSMWAVIGEPISSSERMTVQFAVPPRCSVP